MGGVNPKSDPSFDRAFVPVHTPPARLNFSGPTEHSLALNPTMASGNPGEFLTLLTGRALDKWRTRGKIGRATPNGRGRPLPMDPLPDPY